LEREKESSPNVDSALMNRCWLGNRYYKEADLNWIRRENVPRNALFFSDKPGILTYLVFYIIDIPDLDVS
jgi:hypothetical protein